MNLGDIKVNRDDKLTDPIVWLDRLSVIFRFTLFYISVFYVSSICASAVSILCSMLCSFFCITSHTTPEVPEGQVHPCRDVIVQVGPGVFAWFPFVLLPECLLIVQNFNF